MMRRNRENKAEEREAGLKRRMENQRRELEKLRKELARTRVGAAQLQTAVDGLLTAVILAFGQEGEDGEKRLELPVFSALELREGYLLQARRREEGGGYALAARPRKTGAEEKAKTGGEQDRKAEG